MFLENDVNSATTWFENNHMCANPGKFQSIILKRDGMQSITISVQDYTIVSNSSIKVLGVTLDNKLKFDRHIWYPRNVHKGIKEDQCLEKGF